MVSVFAKAANPDIAIRRKVEFPAVPRVGEYVEIEDNLNTRSYMMRVSCVVWYPLTTPRVILVEPDA